VWVVALDFLDEAQLMCTQHSRPDGQLTQEGRDAGEYWRDWWGERETKKLHPAPCKQILDFVLPDALYIRVERVIEKELVANSCAAITDEHL
jgi:hypothetical protein